MRRAVPLPGHLSQHEHVIKGPHLYWARGRVSISMCLWWQISLLELTTCLSAGPPSISVGVHSWGLVCMGVVLRGCACLAHSGVTLELAMGVRWGLVWVLWSNCVLGSVPRCVYGVLGPPF